MTQIKLIFADNIRFNPPYLCLPQSVFVIYFALEVVNRATKNTEGCLLSSLGSLRNH